jgi:hypothetical protein
MIKSTSVIFAFVFFLTLLTVQTGKGIGIDFRFLSEIQSVDEKNSSKVRKDSDSGNKGKNKKLIPGAKISGGPSDEPVSKPVNIAVELTRVLFGKYLKKID